MSADIIEKTVTFYVDPHTGNLTCSPTVLHAEKGYKITFQTDGRYPFTVVPKGASPLEAAYISSTGDPKSSTVNAVPLGVYSFACAVCDPERREVYIDAGCPSIIIGPGQK